MTQEDNFVKIGQLKKTYGSSGALRFVLYKDVNVSNLANKYFYLKLDGVFVPFFPSQPLNEASKSLELEGINNEAYALELTGQPMFVEKSNLIIEGNEEENEWDAFKGFKVFDQNEKNVGIIEEVQIFPMQIMLILNSGMIPYNQEWVVKLDEKKKILHLILPEGLI